MPLPMAVPICIWMASIAPMSEGRPIVACWATWALPAISGRRIFVKDLSSLTLWTIG